MANGRIQSLQLELEGLQKLHNFLVQYVCDSLREVAGKMQNFIVNLKQTGVPEQECDIYNEKLYMVDKQNFEKIERSIREKDLVWIQRYIKQIQQQMAAIGFNPGSVRLMPPSQSSSYAPSHFDPSTVDAQDYEEQLKALCNLMDFLVEERENLNATIEAYGKLLNRLLEMGVPRQVIDHYVQNCAKDNVNYIRNVIVPHIQKDDYDQLMGLFREIYASLSVLGKSYSRQPRPMS